MPALQIQFYCLCLFVRDATEKRVHVVMPTTHSHHKHLVRLYRVAVNGRRKLFGRMEGLELELGGAMGMGTADLYSLALPSGGRVVDLTYVTADASGHGGVKAPWVLVNQTPPELVSRVKLGAGRVIRRAAQAHWRFKNNRLYMAHTLTWQIDKVPDLLVWKRMSGTLRIPLKRLSDLGPQQPLPLYGQPGPRKQGYHIRVSHTMGPDDATGTLNATQVKEHFRHFYDALHHTPKNGELPELDAEERFKPVGKFNCGAAQVELE